MPDRRRRAWADTIINVSLANNGSHLVNLLTGLAAADTKTVSRILVDITGFLAATDQSEAAAIVHLGIAVASEEAFDSGIDSLPATDVTTDYPQAGWIYVASKVVLQGLPIISGGGGPTRMLATFKEDLRGQRKVDRGVLYLAIRQRALTSTLTTPIYGRVRALCLT